MVDEKTHNISEAIIENLSLTWEMYTEAIKTIPNVHWRTGDIDNLYQPV